jgi:UDP-N-acetylmuramate--alanine ligase
MKHYHLVGIGGISMSAIALHLLNKGHKVTGSDPSTNQQIDQLEEKGVVINHTHVANNINSDIDTLVYSSAVTDNSKGWIEVETARKLNIPYVKRAKFLSEILSDKKLISITGMHGKTTTTGMIAEILEVSGLDPTVFIGTNVKKYDNTGLRDGSADIAVVETCEYDRSLLEFAPDIAVITNIEEEHLDYFTGGINEIVQVFSQFITKIKPEGLLIVNADDENISKAIKLANNNDIRIVKYAQHINSDIVRKTKLQIPGDHNIDNALAAYTVAKEFDCSDQLIFKALTEFSGIGRRSELLYDSDQIKLYSDYAHHPTEVVKTLRGFRELFPNHRLICVFQPHHQARTKLLFDKFIRSFGDTDKLILLPVYEVAGRESMEGVDIQTMADAIHSDGTDVSYLKDFRSAERLLIKETSSTHSQPTVILIMGAGDVHYLATNMEKKLNEVHHE